MDKFISMFDIDGLKAEFEKLEPPKGDLIEALAALTGDVGESDLVPFKLGGIKKFFQNKIKKQAVYAAAWELIRPSEQKQQPSIDDMRIQLGLEKTFDVFSFRHAICSKLYQIADENSKLSRLIYKRIADIEFEICESENIKDMTLDYLELSQRSLLRTVITGQAERTWDLITPTLSVAAKHFSKVVTPRNNSNRPANSNANLMLPISGHPSSSPFFDNCPGIAKADDIWDGVSLPSLRVLAVVADTRQRASEQRENTSIGFYTPDIRPKGQPIPGAPTAWAYRQANSVFVDDLPDLPIESDVVNAKWKDYMTSGAPDAFSGKVFVSMPILVKQNESLPAGPVAIVNINFNTDCLWPRLLSKRWLDHAHSIITPILHPVIHAAVIYFSQVGLPYLERKALAIDIPDDYKLQIEKPKKAEGG